MRYKLHLTSSQWTSSLPLHFTSAIHQFNVCTVYDDIFVVTIHHEFPGNKVLPNHNCLNTETLDRSDTRGLCKITATLYLGDTRYLSWLRAPAIFVL